MRRPRASTLDDLPTIQGRDIRGSGVIGTTVLASMFDCIVRLAVS